MHIECTIERGGLQSGPDGSGLRLNRSVRLHLRPFRLPHDADFVLRVGDFDVLASPVDGETAVFAKFGDRNHTAILLRALWREGI